MVAETARVACGRTRAVNAGLPILYLARHGETAWSITGQHTGRTDLPLIDQGERNARRLGQRLSGPEFEMVLASPLQRAWRTCELAGFGAVAERDEDLVEWDYGRYEGLKSTQILSSQPGWELFRDGCPDGESPAQVAARADRVIGRVRRAQGNVLVFSSGHILRMIATRWLGLEPTVLGSRLHLDTASVSELGYDHSIAEPVIRLWNDDRHRGD